LPLLKFQPSYIDTLYKVDILASFIGHTDLLASCAVYADILYRVSSTSRQHVYGTCNAEFSDFFCHGTLCTSVNIYGTGCFVVPHLGSKGSANELCY